MGGRRGGCQAGLARRLDNYFPKLYQNCVASSCLNVSNHLYLSFPDSPPMVQSFAQPEARAYNVHILHPSLDCSVGDLFI